MFRCDPDGLVYDFDYIKCGACCSTRNNREHLIYITAKDLKRLPRGWSNKNAQLFSAPAGVASEVIGGLRIRESDGIRRCVALKGVIGKKAVCKIYRDRPKVCRAYEMGSPICLDARKSMGLNVDPLSKD